MNLCLIEEYGLFAAVESCLYLWYATILVDLRQYSIDDEHFTESTCMSLASMNIERVEAALNCSGASSDHLISQTS